MNITRENIDALNAIIKVKIDKADYEEKLNNVLKDYKKKANIPGFRPGHVPFGMINRMYRLPVLIEEVNKLVLESMDKYIKDEGLNLLGEPIPSEKEQNKIDFQSQEDFEFAFDLGLSPEFEIDLSVADKIKFYDIQVDEVTIKNYVKNYARRYGTYKTGDVVEEDSMLKGDLLQMDDDGNELPDGINVEDSTLYVGAIKDDDTKKSLTGLKNGDSAAINLKKAFPNDNELAAILKTTKDKVNNKVESEFRFTIKEISKFSEAEINQELFDKIYGAEIIKSEEEFNNKVKEEIKNLYDRESEYKFFIDAKDALINNIAFNLPAEFLKRWLKLVNKEHFTEEQIEKEFPVFEKDLRWQILKNKIAKKNDFKITDEEINMAARSFTKYQFAQYGLYNMTEEQLDKFTAETLKKDEDYNRFVQKVLEDKVMNFVKQQVSIDFSPITLDEFKKFIETK